MSTELISNLKSQIKLCQQLFEQLTEASPSTPTPTTPTPTPTPTAISTAERPKKRYIKTEEILKIFNITKAQYNNILVRIMIY
jgi:hypothetical protein